MAQHVKAKTKCSRRKILGAEGSIRESLWVEITKAGLGLYLGQESPVKDTDHEIFSEIREAAKLGQAVILANSN